MILDRAELGMLIDGVYVKRGEYYRLYEIAYDRDIADIVQDRLDALQELVRLLESKRKSGNGKSYVKLNAIQIELLLSAMKARLREGYKALDGVKGDREQTMYIQDRILKTNEMITRLLREIK